MANVLAELQTRVVGLVVPPQRLTPTPPIVDSFRSAGIDVANRLNLKPSSREELLRSLRRFRSKYEIVSVDCAVQSVARVAVRDRRVDIVYFPRQEVGGIFRGNLAKICRAALEFNLSELTSGPEFGVGLRRLRREIEVAAEGSTTVIGCTRASNLFELRSPRDVAAILHLLGLPLSAAVRAVSDVPLAMVRRNRLRMEEPRLEDGIRVLRRSPDDE
jgi:RNase P/RNase MRP subunit p30